MAPTVDSCVARQVPRHTQCGYWNQFCGCARAMVLFLIVFMPQEDRVIDGSHVREELVEKSGGCPIDFLVDCEGTHANGVLNIVAGNDRFIF